VAFTPSAAPLHSVIRKTLRKGAPRGLAALLPASMLAAGEVGGINGPDCETEVPGGRRSRGARRTAASPPSQESGRRVTVQVLLF
jgi:hypothetical protein